MHSTHSSLATRFAGCSAQGKRMQTRPVQSIDRGVSLNRALWMLAEEMCELKARATRGAEIRCESSASDTGVRPEHSARPAPTSSQENHMATSTLDIMARCAARSQKATSKAERAFARLLQIAEGDSGQTRRVAAFIAGTFNGRTFPFDLFELRAVDVGISDDTLCCLYALRWARADLYTLVPNGETRVREIVRLVRLAIQGS